MPKVDPTQYLLDALSVLTGGLIKDMQTLILGLVVCSFILMALDLLKNLILLPALESAASFLADPVGSYRARQINNRIIAAVASDGPSARPYRNDVEVSPLRERDLDPYGSLEPGPDSTYANNHWERDGVELSEERYASLESAMDEAEYNERMKHRLSDDEVDDLVHSHADRLRY
ncbi:MAG: hypothetical protein AB7U29_19390 [Desulfobulbus sp.]